MTGEPIMYQGIPGEPHTEINEAGQQLRHPGYTLRRCNKCGEQFMVGRFAADVECGNPHCGQEKVGA